MLEFPTQAEQLAADYAAKRIHSIAKEAAKRGVDREKRGTEIIYTFEDDTTLHTQGHGHAYKVWTDLP